MRELTGHFDGCGLTERCHVRVTDEPHPTNGANHRYELWRELTDSECTAAGVPFPASVKVGEVQFQYGPRNVPDSIPGTLDGALLSVLIDRQDGFQAGPFACTENEEILGHYRDARRLTILRAQERAARGVLGKNQK